MSALAPTLQAFFTTRLARQRQASPRTVATYRDAFRLLLAYAEARTGKHPCDLDLADLDIDLISGFLDHLEVERHNRVTTRNARLTAIHSFYRFAAYRHPEHAELISQVLAIPAKRTETAPVSFLAPAEIDAVVSAPDPSTWAGRRDRALLTVAVQTGLRLSELIGLRCTDVHLGTSAHLTCIGKGRKQRQTPLGAGAARLLQSWLGERGGQPTDPLSHPGEAAPSAPMLSSASSPSMSRPPPPSALPSPPSR